MAFWEPNNHVIWGVPVVLCFTIVKELSYSKDTSERSIIMKDSVVTNTALRRITKGDALSTLKFILKLADPQRTAYLDR